MAPVRGDGMRGLAVFISDIRNCKFKQTNEDEILKLESSIGHFYRLSYAFNCKNK